MVLNFWIYDNLSSLRGKSYDSLYAKWKCSSICNSWSIELENFSLEKETIKRENGGFFPRNPYKEVIDIRIEKCRNTMADYEFLVGEFYYKKGSCNAAIKRFEGLLKKYPDYKGEPDVLFYTGMSYKNLGQKAKASECLRRLVDKYPNNKLVKDAKKGLASLKP